MIQCSKKKVKVQGCAFHGSTVAQPLSQCPDLNTQEELRGVKKT